MSTASQPKPVGNGHGGRRVGAGRPPRVRPAPARPVPAVGDIVLIGVSSGVHPAIVLGVRRPGDPESPLEVQAFGLWRGEQGRWDGVPYGEGPKQGCWCRKPPA
jgi:hypothetical protein